MAKYVFLRDDNNSTVETIQRAILGLYETLNSTFEIGDKNKLYVGIRPTSKKWKYDFNSPMHMKEIAYYDSEIWLNGQRYLRLHGTIRELKHKIINILNNPIFREADEDASEN